MFSFYCIIHRNSNKQTVLTSAAAYYGVRNGSALFGHVRNTDFLSKEGFNGARCFLPDNAD